jgi:hypothetical protein
MSASRILSARSSALPDGPCSNRSGGCGCLEREARARAPLALRLDTRHDGVDPQTLKGASLWVAQGDGSVVRWDIDTQQRRVVARVAHPGRVDEHRRRVRAVVEVPEPDHAAARAAVRAAAPAAGRAAAARRTERRRSEPDGLAACIGEAARRDACAEENEDGRRHAAGARARPKFSHMDLVEKGVVETHASAPARNGSTPQSGEERRAKRGVQ